MKTVILLTGCINPNGMPFTQLNDACERQKQYVDAIKYYLSNTDCPIIFCENSNTDISPLFDKGQDRLEFLTFSGNQDKLRGKGYGEAEIIDYAFHHSSFIQDDSIIIKITGRLIVNNIANIIKSMKSKQDFITCMFHSDLKFADSRIFCATQSFYQEFLSNSHKINDNVDIYFEHILADAIIHSPVYYIPFSEEPLITGISGTTGKKYSTKMPSFKQRIRYKLYTLEQAVRINKMSHNKYASLWLNLFAILNVTRYKLLNKIINSF